MQKTLSLLSAVSILTLSSTASFAAPAWTVDPAISHLTFETKQGDKPVIGEFKKFKPVIEFSKEDLATSHIKVDIETGSALTGDKTSDEGLPSKDWFNIKAFPTATFESKQIISKTTDKEGVESYEAIGKLTILGVTRDVVLPFTLKADGQNTNAVGSLTLKRLDYGMGALVDPNGAMVSNDVTVKFDITAHMTATPAAEPATTTPTSTTSETTSSPKPQ